MEQVKLWKILSISFAFAFSLFYELYIFFNIGDFNIYYYAVKIVQEHGFEALYTNQYWDLLPLSFWKPFNYFMYLPSTIFIWFYALFLPLESASIIWRLTRICFKLWSLFLLYDLFWTRFKDIKKCFIGLTLFTLGIINYFEASWNQRNSIALVLLLLILKLHTTNSFNKYPLIKEMLIALSWNLFLGFHLELFLLYLIYLVIYKWQLKIIVLNLLILGLLNLPLIWCGDELLVRFMKFSAMYRDSDTLSYTLFGTFTLIFNLNQQIMTLICISLTSIVESYYLFYKKERDIYKIFSIFFICQLLFGIAIWGCYLLLFFPFALYYAFEKMGEIYFPWLDSSSNEKIAISNLIKRNIKPMYFFIPFIAICFPIPYLLFSFFGLGQFAIYKRSLPYLCFIDIWKKKD